jgi:pimeloyl-ACP methyl ester carboxylesterase
MSTKNYEIVGNGTKTIVFIHSFHGNSGSWQWLAKRLSKSHKCVLINLPGFNNSKPLKEQSLYDYSLFINKQIESLKITDYTICGHGMGAKISLYAALMNENNKPKKIILIAPSPPTSETISATYKNELLELNNREQAEKNIKKSIVRKLRKVKLEFAIEAYTKIHHETKEWWLNKGMEKDISESIKNLEIPTFVICSKDDPIISMETIYNDVMPYLSMGTLIAVNRVGHFIPLESTRKLARHIKKISKIKYDTILK